MKRVFVPLLLLFAAAMSCPVPPVVSHPVLPIAKILPAQTKVKDGPSIVPLTIEGDVVKTVRSLPFKVIAPPPIKEAKDGKFYSSYRWNLPLGLQGKYNSISPICEITYAAKGEYHIEVEILDWTSEGFGLRLGQENIVVNETLPGPTPPGPTPPGPNPPNPPGPVTGLRVIFIYESADESKYPRGQIAAMYSTKVKDYLDAKCKGGAEGWKRFDKDQDVSKLPEPWPKMWDAIKPQIGKLPQIAIVTDQKGEIFPVPNSVEETLTLLKKYGG